MNYGEFASSDDAETFGAAALGLTRDEYYALICDAADQLSPGLEPAMTDVPSRGCPGSVCRCG